MPQTGTQGKYYGPRGIFTFRCPTTFRTHVTDDKPRSAILSRAMGAKPCAKFVLCPEKITQRQWTQEFQRSLCRRGFTHKMSGMDCTPPSPPSRRSHPLLTAHLFTLFVTDQRCSTKPGRDLRHQWGCPYPLSPLPKFCHLPRLG